MLRTEWLHGMTRVMQGITIYILSEADADENLTSTIEVTGFCSGDGNAE